MKIALAQLDPVVGDVAGNLAMAKKVLKNQAGQVDLILFPELFLSGYPPMDLLERPAFIDEMERAVEELARATADKPQTAILIGAPVRTGATTGKALFNAALLLGQGRVLARRAKRLLPTYDVFDENRYFAPGELQPPIEWAGQRLGVTICEDAFTNSELWPEARYDIDPVADQAAAGATILVNLSASPFVLGKDAARYRCMAGHAKAHGLPFVYVNQVGGNDELIFDGSSFATDATGALLARLPSFQQGVVVVDRDQTAATDQEQERTTQGSWQKMQPAEAAHRALVLGLADYVHKCGFDDVVLGLSGGIDSAVVAGLAAEALGPDKVMGVAMPSRYSSSESLDLARKLADNLGIRFEIVPVEQPHQAYLDLLAPIMDWTEGEVDLAQENLQARIRGNILMALSNRYGSLVLSTGNKSELAVGYCTLYGDMSGGLAVISDLPKTLVYDLARHINAEREIIPERIITRPPSAELKPDQKDTDSLPPYPVLDEILRLCIEEQLPGEAIVEKTGQDPALVERILKLVQRNEYKRRQAAIGLKVTTKSFGMGRRMPVAARYHL